MWNSPNDMLGGRTLAFPLHLRILSGIWVCGITLNQKEKYNASRG